MKVKPELAAALTAGVIALGVAAAFDGYSATIVTRVLIVMTVGTGLNLVSGLAGQISLGHGALLGVSAYTTGWLTLRTGNPFLAGGVGLLAAAAAGLVLGLPSLRVRGQYLALVTIGGALIFVRLVGGSDALGGDGGLAGIPSVFGRGGAIIAAVAFATAIVAVTLMTHSVFGRQMAATKDSELAAEMSGVNVFKVKLLAFIASGLIAGAGGIVFALTEGFLAPAQFDLDLSLLLLLICIVGGLGRPFGAAFGSLVLVTPFEVFPNLQTFQLLIVGAIAIAVLFMAPGGIAGAVAKARRIYGIGRPSVATEGPFDPPVRTAPGPALRAEGIVKRFDGVIAVDNVSIELQPGSIHALIGPNGSGKSTFIDCITGVRVPEGGNVTVAGSNVTGRRPHVVAGLKVARTFQSVAQLPSLNIAEAVALTRDAVARSKRALGAAGVDVELGQPSGALSYAQAKRLELARALATDPELLILDEPAAGYNAAEIEELASLLRGLASSGVAILLADHNMGFVLSVADEVTVLDHGRVIAAGSPSHVRSDARVRESYLGDPVPA